MLDWRSWGKSFAGQLQKVIQMLDWRSWGKSFAGQLQKVMARQSKATGLIIADTLEPVAQLKLRPIQRTNRDLNPTPHQKYVQAIATTPTGIVDPRPLLRPCQ